jgi:Flp pilus assembly protein TadD
VAPIVCQVCGAKTKAGRLRCPRCGEILATTTAETPAAAAAPVGFQAAFSRYRGPIVLAGTLLSIIVLLIAITRQRAPVPPATPRSAAAKPVAAAASTAAPARPDPGFLDPKTGGVTAYAAGDYVSALEHYKKAVSRNPNDGDALNNLGQLLVRNGDPAAAIPHFQKAVQLYPSVWAYRFNLAHARGRLGEWSEAADDYRQARNLFPDDYVTHFNLGMALHRMGDQAAAIHEFKKGAELAPSEPSFHLSIGTIYDQLNRPVDALRAYEQYLALSPPGEEADKVKARIELLRKPA